MRATRDVVHVIAFPLRGSASRRLPQGQSPRAPRSLERVNSGRLPQTGEERACLPSYVAVWHMRPFSDCGPRIQAR
jgi:hypothetical protein